MTPLAWQYAVDLGYGRGRASPAAAASIRRIDAQLGRLADINEAWRSPADADANRARWIAYQNGNGPVAPYALGASDSVHCSGDAADSDDWYIPGAAQIWRDNGWRQTARYPGTNRDEPWHGEYFANLDNHRSETAAGSSQQFPTDKPSEEEEMNVKLYLYAPTNSLLLVDHLNKTIRNLGNKNNNTLRTWYANNKPYETVDDPTWAALVTGYAYVDQPNIEAPTVTEG